MFDEFSIDRLTRSRHRGADVEEEYQWRWRWRVWKSIDDERQGRAWKRCAKLRKVSAASQPQFHCQIRRWVETDPPLFRWPAKLDCLLIAP